MLGRKEVPEPVFLLLHQRQAVLPQPPGQRAVSEFPRGSWAASWADPGSRDTSLPIPQTQCSQVECSFWSAINSSKLLVQMAFLKESGEWSSVPSWPMKMRVFQEWKAKQKDLTRNGVDLVHRFINTDQMSEPLGFSNIIQSKNLCSEQQLECLL